jgi:predicted MFS family arabinose efflux permease
MLTFQLGRFLQALSGASFVTLTNIGVVNVFEEKLMARALGVVSIVWGFAAFSGPLVGGLFATFADWRTAFLYTGLLGLVMAGLSYIVLDRRPDFAAPKLDGRSEDFPLLRLGLLLAGVMAIASAGIGFSILLTPLLVGCGLLLMAGFVWLDVRATGKRLLPVGALNPFTRVGAAMGLILFLSSAVVAVFVFAPVLMAVLYGLPPLMIGYIMFVDSLGWSTMAAIFSGVPPEKERGVIVLGAGIIVVSVAVFNMAFHTDLIWLLWAGFFLQGAGFGISWTLIVRRAARHPDPLERDRIAGAVTTVKRVGLALGAAGLGIVANANGFADTMSIATAKSVAQWIVGLSLPLALTGFAATLAFVRQPRPAPVGAT